MTEKSTSAATRYAQALDLAGEELEKERAGFRRELADAVRGREALAQRSAGVTDTLEKEVLKLKQKLDDVEQDRRRTENALHD